MREITLIYAEQGLGRQIYLRNSLLSRQRRNSPELIENWKDIRRFLKENR